MSKRDSPPPGNGRVNDTPLPPAAREDGPPAKRSTEGTAPPTGSSPESEDRTFIIPGSDRPTTTIGPYRLLECLGEGGMGAVYLAEQQRPVRRQVALKIVKLGMDTKEVIGRFEIERQALAMMNHPNIAQVFDAGATETGRPYFVMEYVPGVPITQYCNTQRLTIRERLMLFQHVCEGVQHAHQKAIIHRDLKPTNILVTSREQQAVPKIIDFGVAKATAQHLSERTLHTELGRLLGTPEYMSPEQAELTGQNIDTRTDVYSLGVLLYELLVGKLPFEPAELRQLGFDEIRRKIREEEPQRPSARITRMGRQSTDFARSCRTTPVKLSGQLHGDLDWITLKALEKDRTRRYGSPAELAADIGRYLEDRPVVAGSPGTVYRLQKFIKRHKVGVGASASIFVLLVAFAVGMTIQARRTAQQRDRALLAEGQARAEAQTAAEVSRFLVDLFEVSDPGEAHGNTVTAREILDQGASRIEQTLTDQPAIQARLMETMGSVYFNLGLYDPALDLGNEALRIQQSLHPVDHPDVVESLLLLANVHLERGEFEESERLNRGALAMSRRVLGDRHPTTARVLQVLAILLKRQDRREEAETAYREALAIRRQLTPPDPIDIASTLTSLGELLRQSRRLDEAAALHREALDLVRAAEGDYHPVVRSTLNNLALVYEDQESFAEAENLLRQVVEVDTRLYGTRNPRYARSLNNLAGILYRLGKLDEAERIHRQALAIRREVLEPWHPDLAASLNNLSNVLQAKGDLDEAAVLLGEALAIIRHAMGENHPRVGITLYNLGKLLDEKGDHAAARRRFQEAEPIMAQQMPADNWRMGNLHSMIGLCFAHEGRFKDGEPLVLEGYQIVRKARGDTDEKTQATLQRVVEFYDLAHRPTEAQRYRQLLQGKATP
jgi:serine/threonine protein kinase/tetratricopeptide (TPR) repeat protein